jgi:hypothetical protein
MPRLQAHPGHDYGERRADRYRKVAAEYDELARDIGCFRSTNTNQRNSQMSKITVTIDAEGRPDNFTFEWEGDPQALRGVVAATRDLAQRAGVRPEQFVESALMQFPSAGPISGPEGGYQRMAILCAVILHFTNEHAGEPLDRLAQYDVTAAVTIRDGAFSVKVDGVPRTLH